MTVHRLEQTAHTAGHKKTGAVRAPVFFEHRSKNHRTRSGLFENLLNCCRAFGTDGFFLRRQAFENAAFSRFYVRAEG